MSIQPHPCAFAKALNRAGIDYEVVKLGRTAEAGDAGWSGG